MPDYQSSDLVGSRYRRWSRINIDNPREGVPSSVVLETEVLTLGENDVIERPVGNLSITLSDPTKAIPLRDPTDGWTLTGATMTMGELYAALGSACWQAALERDAAQL
jgi:hypothetical protein